MDDVYIFNLQGLARRHRQSVERSPAHVFRSCWSHSFGRSACKHQLGPYQHLGARRAIADGLQLAGERRSRWSNVLRSKLPGYVPAQCGVDRQVLRKAEPADIPVGQPTKLDLTVNLTTAKALGLDLPRRCSRAPTR